jgi:hypothetical protein
MYSNNSSANKVNTYRRKTFVSIALMLILTVAPILGSLPPATAKTTIFLEPYFSPIIGVNTATMLAWQPLTTNPLITSPAYATKNPAWPNMTLIFTRPNGTSFMINGPFRTTFPPRGDPTIRDITYLFTPDQKGVWTVNATWPGDDTYEATTRISTFLVGDAYSKRITWCMLSIRPYPNVGLNQEALINAWITPPPETVREYYEDYTFTVRRPDNSIAYKFNLTSEAPGTVYFNYYFDQLGNWSIQMDYPGNWYNLPSTVTRYVNVQTAQIPYPVPDTPLPTYPWTFPVNVYNREWRNIAGPWYQQYYNASGIGWNPYTEAPKSAHIAWQLDPINSLGGFIGSTPEYLGVETTGIYSPTNPNVRTVMAGRGYYTASNVIYCINMSTGALLWQTAGSFNAGATRNGAPVLYSMGTRFIEYNAISGAVSRNLTGLPSTPPNPYPYVSLAFAYTGETFFDDPYFYQAFSGWYNDTKGDWDNGFVVKYDTATGSMLWNKTFAAGPLTSAYTTIYNNLMICRCFKVGTIIVQYLKALNLTTGELEYSTPIMNKGDTNTWVYRQGPALGSGYGLVYFAGTAYGTTNPLVYFAFDAMTGQHKWEFRPPQSDWPWDNFFAYMPQTAGYGQLFVLTYAGVYGVNATNGQITWSFNPGSSGQETPYNSWSFGSTGAVVGGGILFAPETEHSPTLYYRGNAMEAIDVYTGRRVWNISGYYTPTALAYGTLVAQDVPNGGTYGFAKGPSKTTVQASANTIGAGILIKGTVLDMSTAQMGTPAISDDDMTAWMEYLHFQQEKPTNAIGVPVALTAVDQSGKSTNIGTVWSDVNGYFAATWTPPALGAYKIIATFGGSNSYYSSVDETVVGVGATPAPAASAQPNQTPPPTSPNPTATAPPTTSPTPTSTAPTTSPSASTQPTVAPTPPGVTSGVDMYIIVAAVVIIAIVALAAVLLYRRKK